MTTEEEEGKEEEETPATVAADKRQYFIKNGIFEFKEEQKCG